MFPQLCNRGLRKSSPLMAALVCLLLLLAVPEVVVPAEATSRGALIAHANWRNPVLALPATRKLFMRALLEEDDEDSGTMKMSMKNYDDDDDHNWYILRGF